MDSTYGDPGGFAVYVDADAPPEPTALTVESNLGEKFLRVLIENDDNFDIDNSHIELSVSKTIDDPNGAEAQVYRIQVPHNFALIGTGSEGKDVRFNVNPPDNDTWYFWARMYDVFGNFSALYPVGNGRAGALKPIAEYYIKPLRGTGITDVSQNLGLQAMIVEQQTEPAPLTSGAIQLYTATQIDPLTLTQTPKPGSGKEYLWDPIVAGDILNNLTVYLADNTGGTPVVYDAVTLADITDPGEILNGYYNNVEKLNFRQDGQGGWVDTSTESPHFFFFKSGVLQAEQIVEISLDQGAPQIHLIEQPIGSSNPGNGLITYKVNGFSDPLDQLYGAGHSATLEVTYQDQITLDEFTITETGNS
jgi:uncharacterized protein YneR